MIAVGYTLTLLVLTAIALGQGGCVEYQPDERGATRSIGSPIYYGTDEPTITDLTAGEIQAVGYLLDPFGEVFCTATLINGWIALTAAHCIYNAPQLTDIRFGLGDPAQPEVLIDLRDAPYHPTLDVGLLLLEADALSFLPQAQPLVLNRSAVPDSWVGSQVEVAGYGETHDGSTGLHFVALDLTEIQPDILVVNGWGERGICYGDSGGPLFLQEPGGLPVLAAVESHGDQTCVGEDELTRVDAAIDWIDEQMAAFDPYSPGQDDEGGEYQGGEAICSVGPEVKISVGRLLGLAVPLLLVWSRRHRQPSVERRFAKRTRATR